MFGPYSTEECAEFRSTGRLQGDDSVRQGKRGQWWAASERADFDRPVNQMRTTPHALPFAPLPFPPNCPMVTSAADRWYVRTVLGPYRSDELVRRRQDGRLNDTDEVRREGDVNWCGIDAVAPL